MSDPVTLDPQWFVEHEERLSAVEAQLRFLTSLLALSPFGVPLPRDAPRDPRVRARRRPRQEGHL